MGPLEPDVKRKPAQGRPLGHLLAWLVVQDHADKDSHFSFKPTLEQRLAARANVAHVIGSDCFSLASGVSGMERAMSRKPSRDLT